MARLAKEGRAPREHAFSAALFEASDCSVLSTNGVTLHSEQDKDWTEEGPGKEHLTLQ